MQAPRRAERLIGLFLLAALLLGPVALALAAKPLTVLGVPLLFLYFFGVWAGVIALLACAVRRDDG